MLRSTRLLAGSAPSCTTRLCAVLPRSATLAAARLRTGCRQLCKVAGETAKSAGETAKAASETAAKAAEAAAESAATSSGFSYAAFAKVCAFTSSARPMGDRAAAPWRVDSHAD